MFALGEGSDDTRSGLAALLFGKGPSFEMYGDSPIVAEAPITYQRAQYICELVENWYYLPKLQELWHVPMWTEGLQRALEAREAKAAPQTVYHAWALPPFVPADRYKPHFVFGFI